MCWVVLLQSILTTCTHFVLKLDSFESHITSLTMNFMQDQSMHSLDFATSIHFYLGGNIP